MKRIILLIVGSAYFLAVGSAFVLAATEWEHPLVVAGIESLDRS